MSRATWKKAKPEKYSGLHSIHSSKNRGWGNSGGTSIEHRRREVPLIVLFCSNVPTVLHAHAQKKKRCWPHKMRSSTSTVAGVAMQKKMGLQSNSSRLEKTETHRRKKCYSVDMLFRPEATRRCSQTGRAVLLCLQLTEMHFGPESRPLGVSTTSSSMIEGEKRPTVLMENQMKSAREA